MRSNSPTFHALTRMRREFGLAFSCSSTRDSWSIFLPSGVGQLRHCLPYTGPNSPFLSAHSSQMLTPCSCKYLIAEYAQGPGAGAIALGRAPLADVAQEIEILLH